MQRSALNVQSEFIVSISTATQTGLGGELLSRGSGVIWVCIECNVSAIYRADYSIDSSAPDRKDECLWGQLRDACILAGSTDSDEDVLALEFGHRSSRLDEFIVDRLDFIAKGSEIQFYSSSEYLREHTGTENVGLEGCSFTLTYRSFVSHMGHLAQRADSAISRTTHRLSHNTDTHTLVTPVEGGVCTRSENL
ncbi:hypothetical protein Tco_0351402 [Tanacetum coccineum]